MDTMLVSELWRRVLGAAELEARGAKPRGEGGTRRRAASGVPAGSMRRSPWGPMRSMGVAGLWSRKLLAGSGAGPGRAYSPLSFACTGSPSRHTAALQKVLVCPHHRLQQTRLPLASLLNHVRVVCVNGTASARDACAPLGQLQAAATAPTPPLDERT